MHPAKVLIVDDHDLFRRGVRNAIEREEDMEVVGEAGDGREALAKALELNPDLILLDISMPGCDGLEAIRAIKDELPETKIIMLTVHDRDEYLFEAIKNGAEGFLSKDMRVAALLDALRGALQGEAALSRRATSKILVEFARLAQLEAHSVASQLTPREKQVLVEISKGLCNKEIGRILRISENTVKAHITNILKKLRVQNRSQAADYARRWGVQKRWGGIPAQGQGISSRKPA